MSKFLPLLFVAGLLFGGKVFYDHQGARMVQDAVEMAEDGNHEEALDQIREFETWFAWSSSVEEAKDAKEQIRKGLKSSEQEAAQQQKFEQLNRAVEEDRKSEEKYQREKERMERRMEHETRLSKEEAKARKRSRR